MYAVGQEECEEALLEAAVWAEAATLAEDVHKVAGPQPGDSAGRHAARGRTHRVAVPHGDRGNCRPVGRAAALAAGSRKVVLASSAAIYGDNPTVPKLESMPPEPKSPYAETKLAGENLLEAYRRSHGLGATSLRFFNVFGPRQDPRSAYAAAVPIFIAKALRDEPISIHGDGGQTRDFIHVTDIVGALAYAGASKDMAGTYNVGYGRSQ